MKKIIKIIGVIILSFINIHLSQAGERKYFQSAPIHQFRHDEIWTRAYQFSPDNQSIAIVKAPATIQIFDIRKWTLQLTLEGHKKPIVALVFSSDGQYLASGAYGKDDIIIWNIKENKIDQRISGVNSVTSLDFSKSGALLVSGDESGNISLWNTASGKLIRKLFQGNVEQYYPTQVKFSPLDSFLAVSFANESHGIIFFDIKNNNKREIKADYDVYSIDFHPSKAVLAVGEGRLQGPNAINLMDVKTGKILTSLTGHSGVINSLNFSPDGGYLVSSSMEKGVRLRVWDLENGEMRQALSASGKQKTMGLTLSPDGKMAAVHLETRGNLGNPVTMEFYGKNMD